MNNQIIGNFPSPKISFIDKYFPKESILSADSELERVVISIGNPKIQETIDQPEFIYELKKAGFTGHHIEIGYRAEERFDNGRENPNIVKVRTYEDILTLETEEDGNGN